MKRVIAMVLALAAACSSDSSEQNAASSDAGNNNATTAPNNATTQPNNATTAPNNATTPQNGTNSAANNDMGTADTGREPNPLTPLGAWCTGQPEDFSFFVTSMDALWTLSGSAPGDPAGGFGGDFGGLAGADEICQTIGDATGFGDKTWRAFLSAVDGGDGNPIHAIDRLGDGPWTDANGRLVANDRAGLMAARPDGDPQSVADLPDECGVPLTQLGDAHDVVTGSDRFGMLASTDPESTCFDWTTSDGAVGSTGGMGPAGITGTVWVGHSFPRMGGGGGGQQWMGDHPTRGCGKGAELQQSGGGSGTCIGCAGGYGALYCFAD